MQTDSRVWIETAHCFDCFALIDLPGDGGSCEIVWIESAKDDDAEQKRFLILVQGLDVRADHYVDAHSVETDFDLLHQPIHFLNINEKYFRKHFSTKKWSRDD